MTRLRLAMGLSVALLLAATPWTTASAAPVCSERPVQKIPLAGKLAEPGAEVSGMAWYGDELVFLPQYAVRVLYALSRDTILAYLDAPDEKPLQPYEIAFSHLDLPQRVPGFEGYEAIAFQGNRIYLAIEARERHGMAAWIAAGKVGPELSAIRLDPEHLMRLPLELPLRNMAVEALVPLPGGDLLALPEANGAVLGQASEAIRISPNLEVVARVAMPQLEYRLTDATPPDRNGAFWVINYFWPGERMLLQAPPLEAADCSPGPTHQNQPQIERLLQLRYSGNELTTIAHTETYLELEADRPRNWEAIALLEDRGFLLMTDQHPESIFAFVPFAPAPDAP